MTTKDRLKAFLEHNNLSQKKFETLVGLSNGFVNNVGDSIRTESLQKITEKFPALNTAWLLTGTGEMLLGAAIPYSADDPLNVERATIVALKKQLAWAISRISTLEGKNVSYEECLNEIERDTIEVLVDLRKSGKK